MGFFEFIQFFLECCIRYRNATFALAAHKPKHSTGEMLRIVVCL